jgi:hypothetical protein
VLSIASIATLITVVGASIYVVGLLSLVWPIQNKFTGNAPAAWHVVSLIPRTIVVGHGARILWGRPLLFAAFFILLVPILLLASALTEWIGGFVSLGEWLQGIVTGILFALPLFLLLPLSRRYRVRVQHFFLPLEEERPKPLHVVISLFLGLSIANLSAAFIIGIPGLAPIR